jgi:ABC-type uncharacterized transport system substrate-binding protein
MPGGPIGNFADFDAAAGRHSSEIERVFVVIRQQRTDAVLTSGEGVDAGGLMACTVDLAELVKRMADDVHQVLNGVQPGNTPSISPPSSSF